VARAERVRQAAVERQAVERQAAVLRQTAAVKAAPPKARQLAQPADSRNP